MVSDCTLDVVLPHKGMLERTTSAEAESRVPRIRECASILHREISEIAGLMFFCPTFVDVVGIETVVVRRPI